MRIKAMMAAAVMAVSGAMVMTPEAGSSEPLFFYFYYSDAQKTDVVGFRRDICTNGIVTSGPVSGQITPHYEVEAIGLCPGFLF